MEDQILIEIEPDLFNPYREVIINGMRLSLTWNNLETAWNKGQEVEMQQSMIKSSDWRKGKQFLMKFKLLCKLMTLGWIAQ